MKINKLDTSKMMVVRSYRKAKTVRNSAAIAAAANFAIGVNNAKAHEGVNMLISYGCMVVCSEAARKSHKLAAALEPEYQKILTRAKQIYRK